MLTIVHGGQTGVDRGAHEGALANGWRISGYMPRDGRDELGPIPQTVAQFLIPNDKPGLAARTEANVRTAAAALIVVRNAEDPRETPGTAKTLDLAYFHRVPRLIVDSTVDPKQVALWIWNNLLTRNTLPLLLGTSDPHEMATPRLLLAGPRETKWLGAQSTTAALLHRVAHALTEISQTPKPSPLMRAQA